MKLPDPASLYGTALITGAASGIGLALAREFARRGHRLVLTSRVKEELADVAREISAMYGVEVGIIAADLEREDAAANIYESLKRDGTPIDVLVNNAGFGYRGCFWDIPIENHLSLVRVNIEAVLRLTHLFLPEMRQRRRGKILNLASIASFEPGPLLATYHASKAFVLSFSEALATELKDSGITVTALCPGPTDTDFFPKAGMLNTRAFQKAKVMAPADVARIGYEALMRNDRTVVAGGANRALVIARRLLPESAQARQNQTLYQDVKPSARKRHRGDFERQGLLRQ